MNPESDVLAAIEELEHEEVEPKWWEAPERAFQRGARIAVAPPPPELADEVQGHGVFPDAVETHYGHADPLPRRWPSFRGLAPPVAEEDDVRRMGEWLERIHRLSMNLRRHGYGNTGIVLLPKEYPALEAVDGMRVHHLPIRGGYVGYRYDGTFSGIAKAMSFYWMLERALGEPWIIAGRELLRSAVRSERVFMEPVRLSVRDLISVRDPVSAPAPRSFSELERMRVLDLPSAGEVFVGYSMILPLVSDMERELQRQRRREEGR